MQSVTLLKILFKLFCFLFLPFYLSLNNLYAQTNTSKLLENLYSENKETREGAAKKLGNNAIQTLLSIVQDKSLAPQIRVFAISRLAEIRAKEAQPYLIETLADELSQIRCASVESLKRLEYYNLRSKYPKPTNTIQKLVLTLKDPDPKTRIITIGSLSELCAWTENLVLGDVVPYLILMTSDAHPEVRMRVASALGHLLHATTLESFKERLGDSLFEEIMSSLLTMLNDKEEIVVYSTLLSLNGLKFENIKSSLVSFTKNSAMPFRDLAIKNLSLFRDDELIIHLRLLLEDNDKEVRNAAKEVLRKLSSLNDNTKNLR